MRLDDFTLTVYDNELQQAIKAITLPPTVEIRQIRFTRKALSVSLAIKTAIPLYPEIQVGVVSASGPVVSFKVSAPLGGRAMDLLINQFASKLPTGIEYVGNGVVSIDLLAVGGSIIKSIDMGGISFDDGSAQIRGSHLDVDLTALAAMSGAGRSNQAKEV